MTFFVSDKLNFPNQKELAEFVQQIINRAMQGYARYGLPDKRKKYMTRLLMEAKAYKKEGNREQLLNIAVYCWLEGMKPENPKHHFEPTRASVTRRDA